MPLFYKLDMCIWGYCPWLNANWLVNEQLFKYMSWFRRKLTGLHWRLSLRCCQRMWRKRTRLSEESHATYQSQSLKTVLRIAEHAWRTCDEQMWIPVCAMSTFNTSGKSCNILLECFTTLCMLPGCFISNLCIVLPLCLSLFATHRTSWFSWSEVQII